MLSDFKKSILINNIEKSNKYLNYYLKLLDNKLYPFELYIIENILETSKETDKYFKINQENANIIDNKDNNSLNVNKIYKNYIKKYIKYVNNLIIFKNKNYINDTKIECKNLLKCFIKQSYKEILINLKQNYIYWDLFSVNLLFLQIINNFIITNNLNKNVNTNNNISNISNDNNSIPEILILFSELLIKNLSPNNKFRLTIRQIFDNIDNIIIYIAKKL